MHLQGKYNDSLHDFSDCLSLQPTDEMKFQALEHRARIFLTQGKRKEAGADLDKAIRWGGAYAYALSGEFFLLNKNYEWAIQYLNHCINRHPKPVSWILGYALSIRGAVYVETGEKTEAKNRFRSVH